MRMHMLGWMLLVAACVAAEMAKELDVIFRTIVRDATGSRADPDTAYSEFASRGARAWICDAL